MPIRNPKPQKVRRVTLPEGDKYVFQGGKKVLFITPEGRKLRRKHPEILRKLLEGKLKPARKQRVGRTNYANVSRLPEIPETVIKQSRSKLRLGKKRTQRIMEKTEPIESMRTMKSLEKLGIKAPVQYFAVQDFHQGVKARILTPQSTQVMKEINAPTAKQFTDRHPELANQLLHAVAALEAELKSKGFKTDFFHVKTGHRQQDIAIYKMRNIFVESYDPVLRQFKLIIIDQPRKD